MITGLETRGRMLKPKKQNRTTARLRAVQSTAMLLLVDYKALKIIKKKKPFGALNGATMATPQSDLQAWLWYGMAGHGVAQHWLLLL